MRRIVLKAAVLLAGLFAAHAVAAHAQAVDPLVGCYSVELGKWNPPLRPGDHRYHVPPTHVHMTDSIGTEGRERGRQLLRPVMAHAVLQPVAYWDHVTPDSVSLRWTDGLAGVQLDLAAGADSLHGLATALSDAVGLRRPEAAAVLRRVPCDGS